MKKYILLYKKINKKFEGCARSNMIISIWNEMNFIVQIKYYKSNRVF